MNSYRIEDTRLDVKVQRFSLMTPQKSISHLNAHSQPFPSSLVSTKVNWNIRSKGLRDDITLGWTQCARFVCWRTSLNGTLMLNDPTVNVNDINQGYYIPRCKDIMYERLKALDAVFRLHHLQYNLAFGTLLGSVQRQDIFSWTPDVDISMPAHGLKLLVSNNTIRKALLNSGFIAYEGGMRLVRICFSSEIIHSKHFKSRKEANEINRLIRRPDRQTDYYERFLYMDAYMEYQEMLSPSLSNLDDVPLVANESLRLKINPSDCLFDYHDIYPSSRCRIRLRWYPCPRRRHHLLSLHYGPSYLTARELSEKETKEFGCSS